MVYIHHTIKLKKPTFFRSPQRRMHRSLPSLAEGGAFGVQKYWFFACCMTDRSLFKVSKIAIVNVEIAIILPISPICLTSRSGLINVVATPVQIRLP